jgi:hypothetical protein
MLYHYYLGLDPGQSRDYTALSLVEEPVWIDPTWSHKIPLLSDQAGWMSPAELNPGQASRALSLAYHHGRRPHPTLSVRHLERFELGTRYPIVVEHVAELLRSGPLIGKRVALLVDKTGIGAPIVDTFIQAGMRPIAVSIHGGSAVSRDRDGYRVPKRDLVSATQVLLQNERLKIAQDLDLAETLRREDRPKDGSRLLRALEGGRP